MARDDVAAWVADRLAKDTLSGWAARVEDAKRLKGRGTVYVVPDPVRYGGDRWAVRHAHRGGAIARLLGDRYLRLGPPRPVAELLASEDAIGKGVRTPRIVAVAWYPDGIWYRADVVTEHVGDCRTLADRLFSPGEPDDRIALIRAAGRSIADLAEAGVHHTDLNAMNLLVPNDPEDETLWVLDLDGAIRSMNANIRSFMLARLARSLSKHGKRSGRPFDKAEVIALRDASLGR